jgi:hypothetical protein
MTQATRGRSAGIERDGGVFRLTYWEPDARLARYVSGYHRYEVELAHGATCSDALFPGWTNLRFTEPAGAWAIRLGRRAVDPVPAQALFGPSSQVAYASGGSGAVTGAGLTPLGWTRLIGGDASRHANRVVPLADVLGDDAGILAERLGEGEPAEVFDSYFLGLLERSEPEPASVAAVLDFLAAPGQCRVADLGACTGLAPRALLQVTKRHCGFPPKLLLRRARFVAALTAMMGQRQGNWAREVSGAGYFDQSHFVRDCRFFLGRPLRDFMAAPKTMMQLSMEIREQALGAPAQVLHRPPVSDRDAAA